MSCKICYESSNTDENPLISPCLCRGSVNFAHRKCIENWVNSHSPSASSFGDTPPTCPECRSPYSREYVYDGIFSDKLNALIKNYTIFYIKMYKIPLLTICAVWLIFSFFKPLFEVPLTFYSFSFFIITKYIAYFIAATMYMNAYGQDSLGMNLCASFFVNCYNVSYMMYHNSESSAINSLLQFYTYFAIFTYGVNILSYYQQNHTKILYTNK